MNSKPPTHTVSGVFHYKGKPEIDLLPMDVFYMLRCMILNVIPDNWRAQIQTRYDFKNLAQIDEFLKSEYVQGQIIYPQPHEYCRALELTPLDQVKIVILGQDPYHGPGQAHGLSFSVKPDVAVPPSLRNIYKELHQDIGMEMPDHGFLEHWARQGVLMLNTVLSVRHGQAASHQGIGWEGLTHAVIESVNAQDRPIVFMLWGAHAQKYASILDRDRHYILMAPHPSPLSAHRGFLGCQHFSKANEFLKKTNQMPIDWVLPPHGEGRLL